LAALLLAAPAAAQPAPTSAPPAVTVVPVQAREVAPAADFVGRVEAIQAVDIRARVEGVLQRLLFDEGQDISAGQPLFQIEADRYDAAVAGAQAQLARAGATLSQADRALARARELRSSGTVSQAQFDQAQAAFESARADQAEGVANLRVAQLNLDYTHITSPIAGRIGQSAATVGNLVGPTTGTLARVVQLDPIRVVFSISDRDLLQVQQEAGNAPRDEVYRRFVPTLTLANGSAFPEPGRVEFIANEIDPQTATIAVRAVFPNPHLVLLPGQIVSVRIRPAQAEKRLTLPVAAVQRDRNGAFVLVVEQGDRVAERRVRLGAQIGQNWVVEEGLAEGDRVITEGIQAAARPGTVVRPVAPPAAQPSTPRTAPRAGGG
jgi:membrane fusion protein (multidrug efflux system)